MSGSCPRTERPLHSIETEFVALVTNVTHGDRCSPLLTLTRMPLLDCACSTRLAQGRVCKWLIAFVAGIPLPFAAA